VELGAEGCPIVTALGSFVVFGRGEGEELEVAFEEVGGCEVVGFEEEEDACCF